MDNLKTENSEVNFFYVIETNKGQQSKLFPMIFQSENGEKPTREMVINHNIQCKGISEVDVKYIHDIVFVSEERYNELLEQLGL